MHQLDAPAQARSPWTSRRQLSLEPLEQFITGDEDPILTLRTELKLHEISPADRASVGRAMQPRVAPATLLPWSSLPT